MVEVTATPLLRHRGRSDISVVNTLLVGAIAVASGACGGFLVAAGFRAFAITVGLAIVVVGAAAIAVSPRLGAYVLVGVVPAVSGLGRGYPVPGFRLSELLTVSVAFLLFVAAMLRRDTIDWTRFDACALLYAATSLVTGGIDLIRGSLGGFDATNIGTVIGPLQFVLLYLAVKVTLRTRPERRVAIGLLLASGVVVSVLGIAQRASLFGLENILPRITNSIAITSWSFQVERRATSVFPHWQMLSAFEYLVVVLAANLLIRRAYAGLPKFAIWVSLALAGICLVETVTLTTTVASILAILVLSGWNRRFTRVAPVLLLGGAALGLGFAALIETRYTSQYQAADNGLYTGLLPHSFSFRINIWIEQWVPIISHHLATGIGPSLPTGGIWDFTESLYVTLLLRGGLPLLLSYALLMVAWAGLARRMARSDDLIIGTVGQVVFVTVLLLVPMQFAEPYFVDTGFPQVLWALTALAAAGSRLSTAEPSGSA